MISKRVLDMKFRGYRYWQNNDPTVLLLFDINGYIAGIQYGVKPRAQDPSIPISPKNSYFNLEIMFSKAFHPLFARFSKASIPLSP